MINSLIRIFFLYTYAWVPAQLLSLKFGIFKMIYCKLTVPSETHLEPY